MILAGGENFNNLFLLIFIGATILGALITCIKIFGRNNRINDANKKMMYDKKILDDETTIIKKK